MNKIYYFLFFATFISCSEHKETGFEAFEKEDYAAAEYSFDQALQRDPNNPSHLYNLGLAQEKQKKYEEAIKNYSSALMWDKLLLDARMGRARCNAELERYKYAINDLTEYLEHRENDLEALKLRGRCYLNNDDVYEADIDLSIVLEEDPNNPGVNYLLGLAKARMGMFQSAEMLFNKAIMRDEEMEQAYHGIATVRYIKRDYEVALEYYKIAEEKGLEKNDLPIRMGMCYARLNNPVAACEEFKKIKEEKIREKLLKDHC